MTRLFSALTAVVCAMVLVAGVVNAQPEKKVQSEKGWLGVSIKDITRTTMKEKELKTSDGAYVVEVVEKSPAEAAGIKSGDLIVEFSGRQIYDAEDLSKTVGRTSPGTKTTVVVMRKGDKTSLPVAVGSPPQRTSSSRAHASPMIRIFQRGRGVLGMTVMSLNEQLAEYFEAPNKEGVLIEEVRKESAAEKAGLKAGDVLLKIGSRTVGDVDDARKALRKHKPGEKVEVEILRKGSKKTVTVEIEEGEGPWGVNMPEHSMRPHGFAAPGWQDEDGFEFDLDIEPELMKIERRIEKIAPQIESQSDELRDRIKKEISISVRERVI